MKRRGDAPAIMLGAAGILAACSSSSTPPGTLGSQGPIRPADAATDAPSPGNGADASDDSVAIDAAGGSDGGQADGPSGDADLGDGATSPSTDGGPGSSSPTCDPLHVWGTTQFRIPSLPQAGFGRFGGISIDELTIAWTSPTGTIYVADRSPARDDAGTGGRHGTFGPPSAIDTDGGSTSAAVDRVALSPTGMVIIAVSQDRQGFIQFNRAGMGAPWSASATVQFINVAAMITTEQPGQFSEPVLGGDGNTFFYVLQSSGVAPALFESRWNAPSGRWTTGVAFANQELVSASAAAISYATGASSDGLTLFFHDGTTGDERAAWRDSPASPFVRFVDVPGMAEAAPNFRCDTLYFQGTDSGGSGAFIAQ